MSQQRSKRSSSSGDKHSSPKPHNVLPGVDNSKELCTAAPPGAGDAVTSGKTEADTQAVAVTEPIAEEGSTSTALSSSSVYQKRNPSVKAWATLSTQKYTYSKASTSGKTEGTVRGGALIPLLAKGTEFGGYDSFLPTHDQSSPVLSQPRTTPPKAKALNYSLPKSPDSLNLELEAALEHVKRTGSILANSTLGTRMQNQDAEYEPSSLVAATAPKEPHIPYPSSMHNQASSHTLPSSTSDFRRLGNEIEKLTDQDQNQNPSAEGWSGWLDNCSDYYSSSMSINRPPSAST